MSKSCAVNLRGFNRSGNSGRWKAAQLPVDAVSHKWGTLQGTNISHLGKRKTSSKCHFWVICYFPGRYRNPQKIRTPWPSMPTATHPTANPPQRDALQRRSGRTTATILLPWKRRNAVFQPSSFRYVSFREGIQCLYCMDVSENTGFPKSSLLIGFSIINFWGTPIFGNTPIWINTYLGHIWNMLICINYHKLMCPCILFSMHPWILMDIAMRSR